MEDFSGLALPPLFGGHILEAELEPGGVELGPEEVELGPRSSELLESVTQEDEGRRVLDKRKYLTLNRRCKEIEQVNQKILGRLHQVQRLTRRLKKERRFLMKTLDHHGDDYRKAQLSVLLEDEPGAPSDTATGSQDDLINGSSPAFHHPPGSKKRRHAAPRQDKDHQTEADMSVLADTHFGEMPSPTSLSH
ncbi:TCF3 fusion partner homolog [Entelurus aequoreus]|uniref:TCF3 fusion partner homolog n=1 Tax=Entelurus aequoreus TaxID=161455 RepID=UPI002B1D7339|nr:TCF3 fusion partner homolog [Entelurus aequoreus]XP_061920096.1 TCF3 fusion partner homolog [Entelurus aequoreus]XP_061920098.1 TCF3 fusion partner homolog [Entelurus aequoreus]XP_061920099.1 TCF3 fusion partner homolog [Entelurus aequoreus]XP_061920100.1 TCF3 fusion partner homolog [Entelurus aequoreus]